MTSMQDVRPSAGTVVVCDGAKSKYGTIGVGMAVVSCKSGKVKDDSDFASGRAYDESELACSDTHAAELLAIEHAIRESRSRGFRKVLIYNDCQTAVHRVVKVFTSPDSPLATDERYADILRRIVDESRGIKVKLAQRPIDKRGVLGGTAHRLASSYAKKGSSKDYALLVMRVKVSFYGDVRSWEKLGALPQDSNPAAPHALRGA